VDLDAYVSEHGAEWNRLGVLAGRRKRKLTPEEVDELVMLYRRAATHLSVVRSRFGDPTLVAWLSRLVLQARAAVSPSEGFSIRSVQRFFAVSFPATVFRMGWWCLGVLAAFLALSVTVGTLVVLNPSIPLAVLSPDEINQYVNHDFAAYYSQYPPQNFASMVWLNNTVVAALCLGGGILVLPTLYVLINNAVNLGLFGGIMVGYGRADLFFGLIIVHGLLELSCIFIAGGVGLRVGWAWIAPGPVLTRTQSLAAAGRQATVVALGLGAALAVSGLLEAFVTPSPLPPVVKIAIGALVWLGFVCYLVIAGGRAVARGDAGDVAAFEREAIGPAV
jgi:uncharacterized membrane protein SpoIIM required for sporulation